LLISWGDRSASGAILEALSQSLLFWVVALLATAG
jgi:hypothetical protein